MCATHRRIAGVLAVLESRKGEITNVSLDGRRVVQRRA
jgi:hypothetical protein